MAGCGLGKAMDNQFGPGPPQPIPSQATMS